MKKNDQYYYEYLYKHLTNYKNTSISNISEQKVKEILSDFKKKTNIKTKYKKIKFKNDKRYTFIIEVADGRDRNN